MATIIITVLGDDKAGLVDVLSGSIAKRNGSWVRSHMAELAGKFAGIVEATVPDGEADSLISDLDAIKAGGLLHIAAERASTVVEEQPSQRLELQLLGQDHPGIVHQVSRVLAERNVSIDQLESETIPAPQGGHLFRANAFLELPAGLDAAMLEHDLEAIAQDLMIDLEIVEN